MASILAFLGLTDAQVTAALVALVTALVTTLAATPLRYIVDRALLVQKSKTEYEYEARRELRSLIGRYHGRVLDAAVDLHHRMDNLYGDDREPARYRRLDVRGSPDGYYYLSTVRRFLNLAALGLRFEQEATFIDARVAEPGDREFLYFVRAFRWAMTSAKPFAGLEGYPYEEARDHFYADQYRALCAVISDERPSLDQRAFEALLAKPHELQPVLDFFDGLSRDEQRFRWDRLVVLHLLVMVFINAYGYPMQQSGSASFEQALGQLRHPEAGKQLVARLERLGLESHPDMLLLRRAVERTAAGTLQPIATNATPDGSAPA